MNINGKIDRLSWGGQGQGKGGQTKSTSKGGCTFAIEPTWHEIAILKAMLVLNEFLLHDRCENGGVPIDEHAKTKGEISNKVGQHGVRDTDSVQSRSIISTFIIKKLQNDTQNKRLVT